MSTVTATLQIGDVVRKRSARDPYPPLYRIVEFLPGGSEALLRPVSGGELSQVRTSTVTTPDTKGEQR